MTRSDTARSLHERLTQAQTDCEAWRASGLGEKYLEAFFLAEALELQLERELTQPRVPETPAP